MDIETKKEICPSCGEKQWSIMDKHYAGMFGHCWSEDKARWERKELSTEEFERRERNALAVS